MLSVRVVLKPCSDPGCVTRRCVFTQRVEPTFRKAVVSRRRRIGRSGENEEALRSTLGPSRNFVVFTIEERQITWSRHALSRRRLRFTCVERVRLRRLVHRHTSRRKTAQSDFRASAIPPIRVVLCGRAPRSKMNKTPLNFAQKDEEDLKKKKGIRSIPFNMGLLKM